MTDATASPTRYCCSLSRRLARVREHNLAGMGAAFNAIDFLEIASTDQCTLAVWCLQPTTSLTVANVRIDGGVRITGIEVTGVAGSAVADAGNGDFRLLVTVSTAGDFSQYTLSFVDTSDPGQPAPGFDPRLAQVDFSFKAQCPSDFDCASTPDCADTPPPGPAIDYLSKDYASFANLMLDRLGVLMPGFAERNPADLNVTLVEVLAYAADHLSYYQDAVGTEAYLGTARSRVSLRRHARLLDYAMHDGCNARAWVSIEVSADTPAIPAGSMLLTRGPVVGAALSSVAASRQLDADTLVFETMQSISPTFANSRISFYTWSDEACWLAAGATQATLVDTGLALAPGDVLVLEEALSPATGLAQDADLAHRVAVRLATVANSSDPLTGAMLLDVTWMAEDAPAFALCLSAFIGDAIAPTADISVARGNIVLVDHGRTMPPTLLVPPFVPVSGDYAPRLADIGLASAQALPATGAPPTPASVATTQDPRLALPAIWLLGTDKWTPQHDLLSSLRFATDFVVEIENDASASLRFGDDRNGMRPPPGDRLRATYRLGGGAIGNVGAEAISRLVTDDLGVAGALLRVRNPLSAAGGQDPESSEAVRQYAPQAFRVQERAVTEDDYARVCMQFPGVQRAVAQLRWTGSWHTVFISVDRIGGLSAVHDENFNASLLAYVDGFRLAGYDLEVRDPSYVPLDIELQVCVSPDRYAADVELALLKRFGTGRDGLADAFFNPDNFTFGESLYLSRLVAAALGVPGVASARVIVFQRWGKTPNGELAAEVVAAAPLEVLRLDNDPNFPENGRIVFDMLGGL